jgi:mycobactin salicyl-AMP ligase
MRQAMKWPPVRKVTRWCRGPYTLNRYFNAPRDNERSFSPDGFHRTCDRERRFANGYVEVTGRVKDVILRGRETVATPDLEEYLLTHTSIRAAAALPVQDEYLGEKICTAVVFSVPPVTLLELNIVLDELPTTAVGKVDKEAIRASLET